MIVIKAIDLEINDKKYKKILIIGIVIIISYILVSFLALSIPRIYIMDKNTEIISNDEIVYDIDKLYRGSMRLEISGWAYKNGESVDSFESYFVLKNQESGRMYILQTEMQEKPELLSIDGKYNCKYSGLHTQAIVLGLKDGNYDLCILYKNNNENYLVNTGTIVEL